MSLRRFIRAAALCLCAFLIALPARAEEVKIKLKPSGLTANALLDLAQGKTLKDGVILIVHGTAAHNDMDMLKNLREILVGRGHSTLAINLTLGIDDRHGMFDCRTPNGHRQMEALDEIGQWLDWLKSQGAGPVVLLGHSRGGNQAARFVAEKGHPLLTRLVLVAPATWDEKKAAEGYQRQHGRPLAPDLAEAQALVKAGKGGTVMPKQGILYCPTAIVTATTFVSYHGADPRGDTPSIVGEIKLPTLVLAGSNDTVVPDLPQKMKDKADGKRLRFKMVDGADHFFLDLYGEDIADAVEKFLAD